MTTSTSKTTKFILGLAAAASIATTMVPTQAEAGWRGRRNVAIGAGIFGALAVGAVLAGGGYGHGGYYAAPAYSGPDCYWTRQRRVTWDGFVVVRSVRVCD
jgi:MFS family permease